MGLILCGAILVFFYVAKIFFPEFIVGVAEIPSIVKFGNYVDSHWWARNLFDFIVVLTIVNIYCCACCRKTKLNLKCFLVLLCYAIILRLFSNFLPTQYTPINYLGFILCPFLMCLINKEVNKDTFISTIVCFSVDILSQLMSLWIRDIVVMVNNLNTATFFILLIDAVIWRVLLYCYFNYKKEV